MPRAATKRKAADGYKLAEPLPKGEIIEDIAKKRWRLGPSIGRGGFGEIYSAQEATSSGAGYPYVVKIEPHSNGPLFVEMHFYMRNAKPADVEAFKRKKGLETFGMPLYLGSGSHDYNSEKYRFIVMEKFGSDLWKTFLENNRILPTSTVFKVAIQILDVLEYIHERGYVHADIKGANILMGVTKETQNRQVYLVDFGLTTKYTSAKEFKPNPKKAHDGTIEYLSRDAHKGVQTRRGDLEILAYNLIQWLGCTLPWEENLTDPNSVHKFKEEYIDNIPKLIKDCFSSRSAPACLVEFLNYLKTLNFNSEPDYKKIRKMFLKEISNDGDSVDKPLQFSTSKKAKSGKSGKSPKRKAASSRKNEKLPDEEKENLDDDVDDVPVKKSRRMDKKQNSNVENQVDDQLPKERKNKKERSKRNDEELNHVEQNLSVKDPTLEETDEQPKAKKVVEKKSKDKSKSDHNQIEEKPSRKRKPNIVDEQDSDTEDQVDLKQGDEPPNVKKVSKNAKVEPEAEATVKKLGRRGQEMRNYKEESSEDDKSKVKKKTTKNKNHTKQNDDDGMEGYTDAMKEVLKKKQSDKLKTKRSQKPQAKDEDTDVTGFTEAMKEIMLKKKEKLNRKKRANLTSGPSTSTASDKKELADTSPEPKIVVPPLSENSTAEDSE